MNNKVTPTWSVFVNDVFVGEVKAKCAAWPMRADYYAREKARREYALGDNVELEVTKN